MAVRANAASFVYLDTIADVDPTSKVVGLRDARETIPRFHYPAPRTTTSCARKRQLAVGRQLDLVGRRSSRDRPSFSLFLRAPTSTS